MSAFSACMHSPGSCRVHAFIESDPVPDKPTHPSFINAAGTPSIDPSISHNSDPQSAPPSRWAFLWDRPFLWAMAVAVPAACAFALAAHFGVAGRVPSNLLMFLLVYPVLEELVFRGLVLGALRRYPVLARMYGPGISAGNVITAAWFAMAHLVRTPWPWALATFVPGLIFGWSRERHGALLPPVLLHITYNLAVWAGVWLGTPR